MRGRAPCRRPAAMPIPPSDPPQPHGCNSRSARGSEWVVTRARQRRLLVEPPLETTGQAFFQDPAGWANLAPDLVGDIGGRLLSFDVEEYLRFRAVCKPWRDGTEDPRAGGPLDSRFRPRSWAVVTIAAGAGSRRRLLNLTTGASLGVNLPLLRTHCHLCAVDGLLILFSWTTKAICLLDPLRNAVTESKHPPATPRILPGVFWNPGGIDSNCVNGAGFDDSRSPPTLVLCLRDNVSQLIFAKPGGAHWTLVDDSDRLDLSHYRYDTVYFHTLMSLGGRCYIASREGSVYLVQLRPQPKLVLKVDQHEHATRDTIDNRSILSSLFRSSGDGRMLMVRYWTNVDHFGGRESFNQMGLCTVGSITGL